MVFLCHISTEARVMKATNLEEISGFRGRRIKINKKTSVFQTRCDPGIRYKEENQLLSVSCDDSNGIIISSSRLGQSHHLSWIKQRKRNEELGYSTDLIHLLQKPRLVP